MNLVSPLIYNGQPLRGYGVDSDTGDIYSTRRSKHPHKLAWNHRNKRSLKDSYPCMRFSSKTVFPDHHSNGLTINVHILIHETLNPLPVPPGVSDKEWKRTPVSVKQAMRGSWMVNHIDHNRLNYHPSNLEWVFGARENAQRAKAHYSEG